MSSRAKPVVERCAGIVVAIHHSINCSHVSLAVPRLRLRLFAEGVALHASRKLIETPLAEKYHGVHGEGDAPGEAGQQGRRVAAGHQE